jgi:hypothetical protein
MAEGSREVRRRRPRSVADIHDESSLAEVRDWKRVQKVAKKDKQDRPTT